MTVDELKQQMMQLPEPKTDKLPPAWDYWRWQLWHHVIKSDPFGFMGWPEIFHTMLQNHWLSIPAQEMAQMRATGWREAGVFDQPAGFYPADPLEEGISANLVHQAYNLFQWMRWTGKNVADMKTIVEVGGGYGAMALVARRLGFTGRYLIYDLPEFLLLQEFFLSNLGIEAEYAVFRPDRKNAKKKQRLQTDLLIGCYSLSEMNEELRSQIIEQHPTENYLFLYSDKFEYYDNVKFFDEQIVGRLQNTFWRQVPALTPNSFYAFGGVYPPDFYYQPRNILVPGVNGRRWYNTVLTCPACGQLSVWAAPDSEVDYGGGNHHCCIQCGLGFYAWFQSEDKEVDTLRQLLEETR